MARLQAAGLRSERFASRLSFGEVRLTFRVAVIVASGPRKNGLHPLHREVESYPGEVPTTRLWRLKESVGPVDGVMTGSTLSVAPQCGDPG